MKTLIAVLALIGLIAAALTSSRLAEGSGTRHITDCQTRLYMKSVRATSRPSPPQGPRHMQDSL